MSLDDVLAEFLVANPEVTGVIAHVVGDGMDRSIAAGWMDRDRSHGLDPNARFRFASNTKTFTAAAILRLCETGTIDLDDTVGRFLGPAVHDAVTPTARPLDSVTFRHLLSHRSGVPGPTSNDYMRGVVDVPRHRWSPIELIDHFVGDRSRLTPPETQTEYSDTGYILLALLLEAVTHQDLATALRSIVDFSGIGLVDTYLETLEPDPAPDRPRLRQYWGEVDVTDFDPSFDLYGAGGYLGSVADLARFWHALFSGRVFDDPHTLGEMCSTTRTAAGDEFGLGVFRTSFGGHPAWSHSGYFGTLALFVPDSGVALATSTNQAVSHLAPAAQSDLAGMILATIG